MTHDEATQELLRLAAPRTVDLVALLESRVTVAEDGYLAIDDQAGSDLGALATQIIVEEAASFQRTPPRMHYFQGAAFYVSAINAVLTEPDGWESLLKGIIEPAAAEVHRRMASLHAAEVAGEA